MPRDEANEEGKIVQPADLSAHDPPSQKSILTQSEINIAATEQSSNLRKMQEVAMLEGRGHVTIGSEDGQVNQTKGTF